jgi:hypothetical protein
MSSPAQNIYKRSIHFSLLIILLLSFSAAVIQVILQFNNSQKNSQRHLQMFAQQLDAQVLPMLQFAEAIKSRAQFSTQLSADSNRQIPLLSLTTTDVLLHHITTDNQPLNFELHMLAQLQPYFDIAPASINTVKNLYYISAQGFAYNGQQKWSDYVLEQLLAWLQRYERVENGYDRNPAFYKDFILDQAAMSVPLFVNERKIGRFVLALELAPLLSNLEKNNPEHYFLLLDQAGDVIASSKFITGEALEQYQLQIQRLDGLPWSLAMIDKSGSMFSAGLSQFLVYWLSYATILFILVWLLARRYKRKIVGPLQRLSVHVDRLASGQNGVRRIPDGWHVLFDRISQLKTDHKQNTD